MANISNNISIIGAGYVGLVSALGFAYCGHRVTCADIDERKISLLQNGKIPIHEPKLEGFLSESMCNVHFTASIEEAVNNGDALFLCVQTPSKNDGEQDLSYVIGASRQIARHLNNDALKVIVQKSTMLPGSGTLIEEAVKKENPPAEKYIVISNPEFLAEGNAVEDIMHPSRIVIGVDNGRYSKEAKILMNQIYRSVNAERMFVSRDTAMMIKYVSNFFLARRISDINSIALLCERLNIDVCEVSHCVGMDPRIGSHFLNAGIGFGGSCLPKDVDALGSLLRKTDFGSRLTDEVIETNLAMRDLPLEFVYKEFGYNLDGKVFGILGASFKPETDDVREAPALDIAEKLVNNGAEVRVCDPKALENARTSLDKRLGNLNERVSYLIDPYEALRNVNGIILATEWHEFRKLDFRRIKNSISFGNPLFIDGRNIFNPLSMREMGFKYFSIGRP